MCRAGIRHCESKWSRAEREWDNSRRRYNRNVRLSDQAQENEDQQAAERHKSLAERAGEDMDRLAQQIGDHQEQTREPSQFEATMSSLNPQARCRALREWEVEATTDDRSPEYVLSHNPLDLDLAMDARDATHREPTGPGSKPRGGLWSAPLDDEANGMGTRWSAVTGTGGATATEVRPNPGAVIVHLRSEDDVITLNRIFPTTNPDQPFSFSAAKACGVDAIRVHADYHDPLVHGGSMDGWNTGSTAWLRTSAVDVGPSHPQGTPRCPACGQWDGDRHSCPATPTQDPEGAQSADSSTEHGPAGDGPTGAEREERHEMDRQGDDEWATAEPTPEGYLDLYHRTSPEGAEAINTLGRMTSKENTDEAFFSTVPMSEYTAGYGDAVVMVRVPEEHAEIDDEFGDGEEHYRVQLSAVTASTLMQRCPDCGQWASRDHVCSGTQDERETGGPQEGSKSDQHVLSIQPAEPVDFTFIRNPDSSQNYATNQDFGQDLEPTGRYMSEGSGGFVPEGWESGTVRFEQPLHLDYGQSTVDWKRSLSEHYDGATGQALSQALRDDGYDAILTHDKYGTSEVIDLTKP